jgi:hypothetical protein|tara:strand:+ start:265 stop:708 length:444 start_codon:yes stop_codon:yes gene_type:complete
MKKEIRLPKLIVKKSNIHGKGVFTLEPIKEGQRIIEYTGEKIPGKEGDRRSEMDDKLTYIFILDDKYDIDGSVNGNEARLINHSCNPNSYTDIIDGKIYILADKDIISGEEISYDYSLEADEAMKCKCGAKKCRGVVNDPDSDYESK